MIIQRTTSENADFQSLVSALDKVLADLDGDDHAFYAQFNKTAGLKNVVVCYKDDEAIGCGAFRPYDENTVEIKRMYTKPEFRGIGVASKILAELEKWAAEERFSDAILETGEKQTDAISLYQTKHYKIIPNYGQYEHVENSICMKKKL